MRSYYFTVFEHDPARPWVVVGSSRREVALEDHIAFSLWAQAEYPRERFSVQLDPWGGSGTASAGGRSGGPSIDGAGP